MTQRRTDVAGVVDGRVLADAEPELEQHDPRDVDQLLRAALQVPVLPQVPRQRACGAFIGRLQPAVSRMQHT